MSRRIEVLLLIAGLIVAGLLLVTPQPASAAAVTFTFTGEVTQTPTFTPGGFDDPFGGAIDFGTPLSGNYTFDSAASDLIAAAGSASYQSSGPPFGLSVVIGGHTFATTDFLAVNVFDAGVDQYSVLACAGGSGCADLRIELFFQDNEGAMFSGDALPLTPPDLATLELKDFHLVAFVDTTEVQIDGQITTLSVAPTAVPEPGTLLLIGTGLAGLGGYRRARRFMTPLTSKGRMSMPSARVTLVIAAFTALSMAIPTVAQAIDGQVLITQARALAGGVTPGDAPGFPVTISEPGSYKLASNLMPPAGAGAIQITSSDVSLDLNGFALIGQGGGAVDGITTTGEVARVRVKNGAVSGFSDDGIGLNPCNSCHVERVVANSNADWGILIVGDGGSTVTNSKSDFNGNGIAVNGGLLLGNTANNNAGVGLFINGGLASDNAAANNVGVGLQADANLGYARNVFSGNNAGNPEVSGGVNLGHNLCNAALCP